MANHGLTLRPATVSHRRDRRLRLAVARASAPEYFVPAVRAAHADLMEVSERLKPDPLDASARADVHDRRAEFMYTIVNEMR